MTKPTTTPSDAVANSRIQALDLLRGYFIIIIASIHLSYYPSLFGIFDGRGILYTSEADGFFFISGLLIGIIRQRDIVKGGLKFASKRLWKRAWTLYVAGTVLTLAFYLIAAITNAHGIAGAKSGFADGGSFWQVILSTLRLHYSYGWTDFLIYYAGFMFVGPIALWLLTKKKWWVVLLISYALFFVHWKDWERSAFLQWQAPFFIGVVVGYYWNELIERYRSWAPKKKRLVAGTTVAATLLIWVAGMVIVFIPAVFAHVPHWIEAARNNKAQDSLLLDFRSGILRPVALVITMAGLLIIVRRFEGFLLKWFGKLVLPFGKNSLYAYIMEGILLFIIPYFVKSGSFWLNSLIEIVIIALVWIALRTKFLFKIVPR